MKKHFHIIWSEWIFVNIYWLSVFYLYYIYIFWGYDGLLAESAISRYVDSGYVHIEMIIQATLFGLLFNMINTFSDQPAIRRKPLGRIILLKSILYLIGIIFTELFVLFASNLLGLESFKNLSLYRSVLSLNFFVSFITYFIVSLLFINFFLQMNRKIGHDTLYKLLLGRYHKPHGERRIFMFMDLKDSTKITEKLGHKIYSQFIRQCFHDLTDFILITT